MTLLFAEADLPMSTLRTGAPSHGELAAANTIRQKRAVGGPADALSVVVPRRRTFHPSYGEGQDHEEAEGACFPEFTACG